MSHRKDLEHAGKGVWEPLYIVQDELEKVSGKRGVWASLECSLNDTFQDKTYLYIYSI